MLYLALTTTSAKIVEIVDSDPSNKIVGHLEQYVGSMSQEKV